VPVRVEIYTSGSREPLDTTLQPGQNVVYRDPSIFIKSIIVIVPNGETKTYDSTALEKIATDAHRRVEDIQWSVTPQGIFASSP